VGFSAAGLGGVVSWSERCPLEPLEGEFWVLAGGPFNRPDSPSAHLPHEDDLTKSAFSAKRKRIPPKYCKSSIQQAIPCPWRHTQKKAAPRFELER